MNRTTTVSSEGTRHYPVCAACGKARIGRGATGWESEQPICPQCRDSARTALKVLANFIDGDDDV